MKKLASTLPNMLISLTLVTAASGALLGWVYDVTKEPIERQADEAQLAAIRDVAPRFDNNPEAEADTVVADGRTCVVYPASMKGQLVGAAVKATTMDGFAGEITIMCGFSKDGTVRDYRVLQQAETPGLGAKMEAWFRDPSAARSVIGKNPDKVNFTVSKDGGDIDGITAATISSRAFLGALRSAYAAYCEKAGIKSDAASGASTQKSMKEEKPDAASGASAQKGMKEEDSDADAKSGATKGQRHRINKQKRGLKSHNPED